ncbi:myelin-oligodendrocyte glycoprotein-like isoform X3 [Xenopus laevis]|uniref:Myelin-oligodendrocyte glycoprotein-like isoform X3 n=1 Tax=Xenopus laevis TaxID=8355 RepID=A0A8J1LJR0_XENLA|nr:myelin-oligodendrocyte glycoprotein-like isoform X3 [Xenopus laevis]
MSNILITFLILWLLYKESLSFRFKVFSTDSVSVTLGSDVMLPCILSPEMSGENMEIRWFKIQYQPYVHLYENRKDDYTAQKPEFTNRTELLKENITRGVFPLLIRNVTAQDSGEYHCYVESSNHHGRAKVQLNVNERRLPVTARNTYSHFLVICASIILIFFVCICLLLKCLGDLQNKHVKLQSKYEDVLAAQAKLSNGKPHTEASYNSPV